VELKRIAYHEAGHAVMTVLKRRRLLSVTIKPILDGTVPGHTLSSMVRALDPDYKGDRQPYEFRRKICTLLAGPIAELIGMSESTPGDNCNDDLAIATALSKAIAADTLPSSMLGNSIEEIRASFEGVCIEFAHKIFDDITEEVKQTLKDNWQAVEDVVNALLDQETLTGYQVRQIVKRG